MKEKGKNIIIALVVIVLVLLAIINYPLFVKVENGETICRTITNKIVKCR